jgi:ketosteroid isomerase-like protein
MIGTRMRQFPSLAALLFLVSCAGDRPPAPDLVGGAFLESQAELRQVVQSIAEDVMAANIPGLQATHLDSDKFSKFGPRSFERQNLTDANASEAAFFTSISDREYEVRDLKIDVFGDVAVATYYPRASFTRDGEKVEVDGRQTFVFVKIADTWKIAHEHGTIRQQGGSRRP